MQGYGPAPSTEKSQVATGFLRNTGTDPSGPIASRGRFVRSSVKCVDGLKIARTPALPRQNVYYLFYFHIVLLQVIMVMANQILKSMINA